MVKRDTPTQSQSHLPQDTGWSWVIAAAMYPSGGWLAFFVMGGIVRTSGIILNELEHYFHISSSYSIMLISIQGFTYTAVAPIAVLLGDRFTPRAIVMVAGVVGGLGLAVGSLCYSMMFLICTYGLAFGLANGLFVGNVLVMITRYFNKRRSLANGLAMSGSSIALLVFPQLVQYFLDTFALTGTLLILGAFYLQIIIVGALFRPVSFYTRSRKAADDLAAANDDSFGHDEKADYLHKTESTEAMGSSGNLYLMNDVDRLTTDTLLENCIDHLDDDVDDKLSYNSDVMNYSPKLSQLSLELEGLSRNFINVPNHQTSDRSHITQGTDQPSGHGEGDNLDLTNKSRTPRTVAKKVIVGIKYFLSGFRDFKIAMYAVTAFFAFSGMFNVIFFIPFHSRFVDIDKYGIATLMIVCGVGDVLGRVSVGCIGDLRCIVRYQLQGVICLAQAVNLFVFLAATSFVWAAFHSFFYGFLVGAFIPLVPVVIADLVGVGDMPRAFSAILLSQGFGVALLQPILGVVKDAQDSTDGVFGLCAVSCLLGGLILLSHTCIRSLIRKVGQRRSHEVTRSETSIC